MIVIDQSVIINRPIEEVFAFMTEAENVFKWSRNLREISELTPGPLGVGSRFQMVSDFLGFRVPLIIEVTAFEANKLVRSKSASGSFDLVGETRFEAEGMNTKVTSHSEIEAKGVWKLLNLWLPGIIKRQSERDYARLRNTLERVIKESHHNMKILSISRTMVSQH